jgi:acetylornithine deacetylase/succinyl-diaminopimelate desuccinylase-like protein
MMDPHALARDIFRELLAIDTSGSSGTTVAAEAMAARLHAAGVPDDDVRVLGPVPHKGNLVARLRGTGASGRAPLLLLAHIDVVEARREEWTVEPFALTEQDGHFYGRGTTDDKAMAAIWVATLVRLASEGPRPDRDIILALTADEEGGDHNGAAWLLDHHRPLIDAAYGFNEGGYGRIERGKRIVLQVQASEKVYLDFAIEATGRGGHSSLPSRDNAIHRLSRGLARLGAFEFPVTIGEVTRTFFARMAALESDAERAADMLAVSRIPVDLAAAERLSLTPHYNALMRTTCAPTRLEATESGSTIPSSARAVVNCRLLPGESPLEVRRVLAEILGDPGLEVRPLGEPTASPASPLLEEVMGPVERITAEMWPGVPVVPVMSVGATDSRHFRRAGIPMYGVSGIFLDVADVRAHLPDERILVSSFYEGMEFLWRLVGAVARGSMSS